MSFVAGHESLAQLYGRRVDPAAPAVKERDLAVGQFPEDEDVQKSRNIGFTDAGGLLEAHAVGNAHGVVRVGHGILGVPSASDQRHDAVALFPSDRTWTEILDNTCHFEPQDFRFPRGRRVFPPALDQVGPVDGGGHDPDEHLALSRLRLRQFPHLQDFDSSEPFHQDCSHVCLQTTMTRLLPG